MSWAYTLHFPLKQTECSQAWWTRAASSLIPPGLLAQQQSIVFIINLLVPVTLVIVMRYLNTSNSCVNLWNVSARGKSIVSVKGILNSLERVHKSEQLKKWAGKLERLERKLWTFERKYPALALQVYCLCFLVFSPLRKLKLEIVEDKFWLWFV